MWPRFFALDRLELLILTCWWYFVVSSVKEIKYATITARSPSLHVKQPDSPFKCHSFSGKNAQNFLELKTSSTVSCKTVTCYPQNSFMGCLALKTGGTRMANSKSRGSCVMSRVLWVVDLLFGARFKVRFFAK